MVMVLVSEEKGGADCLIGRCAEQDYCEVEVWDEETQVCCLAGFNLLYTEVLVHRKCRRQA